MKFDHVGIIVAEMAEGRRLLSQMFDIQKWSAVFEDPGMGVFVQFGIGLDGPCYELIAPRGTNSPVSVALKSGKGILNHVAYLVSNLESAANTLRQAECLEITEQQSAVAYDGKRVQFFRSPLRFIVELIEAPEHRHSFSTSVEHGQEDGACQ